MPEPFDPYRKWLGIPPAEQPPDHYRLLGVGRFEDDPDTISNAADRQMAHLRTFQAGPHSAISQKLLNEISAARLCLLDPAKKADYDRALLAKIARRPLPAPVGQQPVTPSGVVRTEPPVATAGLRNPATPQPSPWGNLPNSPLPINVSTPPQSQIGAARKKKLPVVPLAIIAAWLLIAVVGVIALSGRGGPDEAEQLVATSDAGPTSPRDNRVDENSSPSTEGAKDDENTPPAPAEAKLEIAKAEWGVDDRWQDITQRVQSLVSDNRLVATTWGSFFTGITDPASGVHKHVKIAYRAAGEPGQVEIDDGDFLYLDGHKHGADERSSSGLDVVEAIYGAGAVWSDVLPRVRRWVHGDRLAVRVELAAQSDPAPGQRKALFVRYRTPKGESATHAWDSEILAIESQRQKPPRPVPTAAGKVVDLLKLIDPKLDAVDGDWQLSGGGLVSPLGTEVRLQVPYSPPEDYELRVTAARVSGDDSLSIGLLVDGRQVAIALDRFAGTQSGMQRTDGENTDRNCTGRPGRVFSDEQPKEVICTVHPRSVRVECQDRVLVDWHGDAGRLSLEPQLATPDAACLLLNAWNTEYLISKYELRPLPAETPTTPTDVTEPVDVLKQIEIARDAVYGEWKKDGDALLAPATPWARLQLPVIPPEEYTLSLDAVGKQNIAFGVVVGGRQVEVVLDGGPNGETSGMQDVDGKGGDQNPTTHQGKVLRDDAVNRIVCTVVNDKVDVQCDGLPIIAWQGDPRSLSLPHGSMMPDERRPFLRCWDSSFRVTRLELSAPAAATRPSPEMLAGSPSSLANLPDESLPAIDRRLPVPAGQAVADASLKVEQMFAEQTQAAKKKLADRLALARKVYQTALQTTDDLAARYVMFCEASDRAASLGDAATAFEAIDQLGRQFRTDPLADKLDVAGEALRKAQAPGQNAVIAFLALGLIDRALHDDRYDVAGKLAALASTAARRAANRDLTGAAERRQAQVRWRQQQYQQFDQAANVLTVQPDPAASDDAGLYLCVVRGQWRQGLPLLSRSQDSALSDIARLELVAGQDPRLRAPLIDAWLATANNQSGPMRTECELQARYWYDRGLPAQDLTVDRLRSKAALEKRVSGMSQARVRPGLDMAMFDGADFQQFRARRVDTQVCANYGFGSPDPSVPGDNFSVRWTGWIKPPAPGKYVIKTSSDDSVRVKIGDKLVIDHWGRGAGDETAEVELTDELQPLRVEFNDYQVTAEVCLRWALKGVSEPQVIPPEAFFYDPTVVP